MRFSVLPVTTTFVSEMLAIGVYYLVVDGPLSIHPLTVFGLEPTFLAISSILTPLLYKLWAWWIRARDFLVSSRWPHLLHRVTSFRLRRDETSIHL